jgi:hypothetical protein
MKENLDFKDLKVIDNEIKLNPDKRKGRIGQLIDRLRNEKNVLDELKKWDMRIENDLVNLEGNVMKQVEIVFSNKVNF